jgi:predicted PurR-regulated permease PerM
MDDDAGAAIEGRLREEPVGAPTFGERRPMFRDASEAAWRSLVIVAAIALVIYALSTVLIVALPVFIAVLLSTLLVPPARWLQRHGWRPLFATWAVILGFAAVLAGIGTFVVPAIASEFDALGPTVTEGLDDIEEWLVEGPLALSQADLESYRQQAQDTLSEFLRSSSGQIAEGAVVAFEVLAGALLALVLTVFFVKDGRRFQVWALAHLPPRHRDVARASGAKAWAALTAYLRGAAAIGLLEGLIIGITLWVLGARLAVPVALLTFFGAFFPVVGAVGAGMIAVLVALVTAGTTEAVIMAIVAVLVQQFDNDLLAPVIYGRIIKLHPVVVLCALAAGGTLAGIVGAFVAVPFTAVAVAIGGELWIRRYGRPDGADEVFADTPDAV